MAFTRVPTATRSAKVAAVIIRADGSVERLGVVSFYHRNPFLNAIGQAGIAARRLVGALRRRLL